MADIAWINPVIHSTASNWAARVVANGGSAVSDNTLYAVSAFCGALDAAAITNLMISVNIFAPDNLTAAITPLIVGAGNDPWTNTNFVAGDLTVQGLKGNASNKYLNTGVIPSTSFADNTDGGLSIYNTFADNRATGTSVDAGGQNGSTNALNLWCCATSQARFDNYNNSTASVVATTTLPFGLGFTSGNRTAANSSVIYTANSIVAFASIGSVAVAGGTTASVPAFLFCLNNNGSPAFFSIKRFSFFAIHHGLSSAQCQALFNAVQALRTQLGGGFI